MKRKNIIISLAIVLCVVVALTGVLAACNDTVNDNMFSAGKLAVQKDGLWGYMDSSGEMVIDAQYDEATPFCGNYAVVTLGDRGLIFRDDEGIPQHMPAFAAHAVDTTGAGDIFHGAFAFGLYQNMSLEDNLRMCSMTSSLSVRSMGGLTSIPAYEQVQQELAAAR